MKLGFNKATCMQSSNLKNDLLLCERNNYDYIEIRLNILKDYLVDNSVNDLKNCFQHSYLKLYAFNSIEDIIFVLMKIGKGGLNFLHLPVKLQMK